MAVVKSPWVLGAKPMPTPLDNNVVNVLLECPVAAAQTALNDLYVMGELPEDCALIDAVYAASDIDTNGTPAHAMSFGLLNATGDDLATVLETAIQVGRAGTSARMTPTLATVTTKTDGKTRTKLAFKVTTAAATGAAGTVYLSVSYRATHYGN